VLKPYEAAEMYLVSTRASRIVKDSVRGRIRSSQVLLMAHSFRMKLQADNEFALVRIINIRIIKSFH
jgi:hypothetical protein